MYTFGSRFETDVYSIILYTRNDVIVLDPRVQERKQNEEFGCENRTFYDGEKATTVFKEL